MGLFTKDEMLKINQAAKKSNASLETPKQPKKSRKGAKAEIDEMSKKVEEYFKDSEAVLITTVEELHDYVTKCIEAGYCGIDTETTGLDRINDTVVGFSLYYPGGHECYVPNNHLIYIFDEPCKGQLTYEQCAPELQRLVDSKCKMIFANADYDIAMIYKDFHVDFCDVCYYDVILAWRVLKENEPRNGLKELYSKYVLKGKGDPKKFSDFFSVDLFPYCKPQVAKLYAANDARITYELFRWQLPYTIKTNPKCQKNHLERLADIIWNIEFPMIKVCALMHRNGIYFDPYVAEKVRVRYHNKFNEELADLREMVNDLVHDLDTPNNKKRPFKTGYDFIPTSPKHVQYLCYDLLKLPDVSGKKSTDKGLLRDFGLPQTDKILAVRSLSTLINSFVDKLITVSKQYDGRIHGQFKSIGADTGRMSCISEGTMISCPGGDKPIEEMNPGDWVYCYNVDTNRLELSKVQGKYMTGIRQCVKINWKSKYNPQLTGSLTCTPDHFLRTQDGRWVMAQDLKPSDSLLYVHRRVQEKCTSLYAAFGQRNEEEHSWIKQYYGYTGKDWHIHHLDKNRNNNSPDNLVICDPKTHSQIHFSRGDGYNHTLNYTYEEVYKMCDDVNWELRKVGHDYGSLLSWLKSYRINYIKEYTCSYNKRCWLVNRHGVRYKNLHLPLVESNLAYALDLADGVVIEAAGYFGISEDEFVSACDKYGILDNHSVTSIEWLEDTYNVYDLCIEGHHNFIANELCVHNSNSPNMQNIPSHATDIRHMFRATPEKDELISSEDGKFTLKYYDRIKTSEGFIPVGNWNWQTVFVVRDGVEAEGHCSVSSDSSDTCVVEVNGGECSITVQHPQYIMFSSDYSQQEPRLASAVAQDKTLIQSFRDGKDVYATIASVAFNKPYKECLEFNPDTHEYQPEGKERRTQAKSIVLGILYGRSTVTIGEQLFGRNKEMSDEEKTKAAQHVYDSVLNAFPALRQAMHNAQESARVRGFTETIFGRRRHIPDMQLPRFEFKAMPGYVNPDVDPLDVSTLQDRSEIPQRVVKQLEQEFSKLKYYGQIVKRTKELRAEHIRVVNNTRKITDATRQCFNAVIQGSAADMTKIALLNLQYNERWNQIGGRVLTPVHDEIICEVPVDFYDEGSRILKTCMEDAGDFLPFHIYCDVETTLRWYGLEYPCPYERPKSFSFETLDNLSESEVSWIQYHLAECEYQLPKFPDKDGNAPIGNAAKGVNGIVSEEMKSYIKDYINTFNVDEQSFVNHIEQLVQEGISYYEV